MLGNDALCLDAVSVTGTKVNSSSGLIVTNNALGAGNSGGGCRACTFPVRIRRNAASCFTPRHGYCVADGMVNDNAVRVSVPCLHRCVGNS